MHSWNLNIFRYENGLIAVTDGQDQIPELQGRYDDAIPKIIQWLQERGGDCAHGSIRILDNRIVCDICGIGMIKSDIGAAYIPCPHDWVSAVNPVATGLEICKLCLELRPVPEPESSPGPPAVAPPPVAEEGEQ